jgi:hypothetical protein
MEASSCRHQHTSVETTIHSCHHRFVMVSHLSTHGTTQNHFVVAGRAQEDMNEPSIVAAAGGGDVRVI